jgi:hypothetical protein
MSCPATSLAAGANMTCTASHTFTQAELDAYGSPIPGSGSLDNTVTASSNEASDATDSLSIPITQTPAMSVVKSSTTTGLSAPAAVPYSYLVTNTGNVALTGISLSDDNDNNDMSCPATSLAAGANMTCTASHTFTQAELDAYGSPIPGSGSLDNTVTASSNEASDATDSLSIPITQTPAMSVVKLAAPTTYDQPGQVITYTYLVTNTGNVTINAPFAIFDDKTNDEACPTSPTSLNPGQSLSCTSHYIISHADMSNGLVTNSAYATGTYNDTTITSNEDAYTITATAIRYYIFVPSVGLTIPGVHIMPTSYAYNSHSTQYVIGELSNNTGNTLSLVDIGISFYDSDDNLLGTSHTYMWPLLVPAWQKGCFKLSSDILNWEYYKIQLLTYNNGTASSNLTVFNHAGDYNAGDYSISGLVRNDGNQKSNNVSVSGTLYNSSGIPIGCDWNYITNTNLNPGETSPFVIDYSGYFRDYADVFFYKLRVAGSLP